MKNALDPKLNINVRALRWVQRMLRKYPENYKQSSFGDKYEDDRKYSGKDDRFLFDPAKMKKPECGSACCYAGWAYLYATGKPPGKAEACTIVKVARKALGLTERQAAVMFEGRSANAAKGIANIDKLIETKGKVIWGRKVE